MVVQPARWAGYDGHIARQLHHQASAFLLLTSFAAIGVILGTIAIYADVSNSVVRRRRELAIRLGLGIAALISWACISYRRASVPDQTGAPAEMEMLRGLRN